MPHIMIETHQNARRQDRARVTEDRGERGREAVSTMNEAASSTDGLGSVDPPLLSAFSHFFPYYALVLNLFIPFLSLIHI